LLDLQARAGRTKSPKPRKRKNQKNNLQREEAHLWKASYILLRIISLPHELMREFDQNSKPQKNKRKERSSRMNITIQHHTTPE
jgi:hypothetical protein